MNGKPGYECSNNFGILDKLEWKAYGNNGGPIIDKRNNTKILVDHGFISREMLSQILINTAKLEMSHTTSKFTKIEQLTLPIVFRFPHNCPENYPRKRATYFIVKGTKPKR